MGKSTRELSRDYFLQKNLIDQNNRHFIYVPLRCEYYKEYRKCSKSILFERCMKTELRTFKSQGMNMFK